MAQRPVREYWLIVLVGVMLFVPLVIVPNYPVGGEVVVMAQSRRTYIFPAGGRTIFPRYRIVALYGTPGEPVLGALGEQDADASIARVKALAAAYQPLMSEHVLPALEIITTVASATPTADSDYSYPIDLTVVRTWVQHARTQGVYVVLDLQPGRTDFLTQAKTLEDILVQPNVGLALDPEWRLGPRQVPLVQIGSADSTEINATGQWLAALTRRHALPQKLFLLHQFLLSMLPGRDQLDTSHAELAYALQMDGQGTQAAKLDTWQTITANPPAHFQFGWKNFYKKDLPMRSPQETLQLTPAPWYISYQ